MLTPTMQAHLLFAELSTRVRTQYVPKWTFDEQKQLEVKLEALRNAVEKHRLKKIKVDTVLKHASKLLSKQFPDLLLRLTRLLDPSPKVFRPISPSVSQAFGKLVPKAKKGGLGLMSTDLFVLHLLPFLSCPATARLASTCKSLKAILNTERLVDARERFELPPEHQFAPGTTTLLLPTPDGHSLRLQMLCRRKNIMGFQYEGANYIIVDDTSSDTHIIHAWYNPSTMHTTRFCELFESIIDPLPDEQGDIPTTLDVRIWVKKIKTEWDNQRVTLELSACGSIPPIHRPLNHTDSALWRFRLVAFRAENWGPLM